jgi:hypothetical protein
MSVFVSMLVYIDVASAVHTTKASTKLINSMITNTGEQESLNIWLWTTMQQGALIINHLQELEEMYLKIRGVHSSLMFCLTYAYQGDYHVHLRIKWRISSICWWPPDPNMCIWYNYSSCFIPNYNPLLKVHSNLVRIQRRMC